MKLKIPVFSLVVLVGATGSGKSTFARTYFAPTEILSSDTFRGIVTDDENSQSASADAFAALHTIAGLRLKNMRLTVVDATNIRPEDRKALLNIAYEHHAQTVAIVLDLPDALHVERNAQRPDRNFGPHVIQRHRREVKRSLRTLQREGFRHVYVLRSEEEVGAVEILRERMWNDRRDDPGPFDIIGDVHGCFEELVMLLAELGYAVEGTSVTPPAGRRAFFVGDLTDRGPQSPQVLRLVMGMVAAGTALCVPGNHDVKLLKALKGRKVQLSHGLAGTMEQLEQEQEAALFKKEVADFIDKLVSHYVLDDGKLVVAHAGMKEELAGRASGKVRDFALYGETTGESDEFGLPVRLNWAANYRGKALVVYGHTPVAAPEWFNNTINIDTGCAFGGALTALRYPEREMVSVKSLHTYAEAKRPFLPPQELAPDLTGQQKHDNLLDITDVIGKRLVETRLGGNLTIREENATAALEVMSRFAINPQWLVYLPPTMSPTETSKRPDALEYPTEAFTYYRSNGVAQVICEEKHMGSRALVVICKDKAAARKRFGVAGEGIGVCYTRTGRRFFTDDELETQFLERVAASVSKAGLWEQLQSDWLLLDCELMPWSAKAQELLQNQYAAVGAAGRIGLEATVQSLLQSQARGLDVAPLLARYQERQGKVTQFIASYRHYCWPVTTLDDLRLAPFHLLASEGAVHVGKQHTWHMQTLAQLHLADDKLLYPTQTKIVDTTNPESVEEGVQWWESLTAAGGEGMVVKPLDFIVKGPRGILQPAIKCRGREYLRIIYGPEYDLPDQIEQLRARGLAGKRSLAQREFALGVEGLERFVRGEPLRRVHECVFGVLALESEPVDPRL